MTIIDLLVKQSKGEEMPKLVKYHNYIYAYDEELCNYEFEESYLFDYTSSLNNEVEVIEENKKIPILKNLNLTRIDIKNTGQVYGVTKEEMIADIQTLQNWINKIIDKLEELE